MHVNRLVGFSVLRLTSTRLPTRWTLSVSAGRTQDWMSLASLRRGMKMPTTFRFVACALPVCRCWSVPVPFGRGREPTTSSTKIMEEERWLRRPASGSESSMPRSSLSHSSTSSYLYYPAHVIRHYGREIDNCIVVADIFVYMQEFIQ